MSEKDKSLFTEKHPDGYSIFSATASKKNLARRGNARGGHCEGHKLDSKPTSTKMTKEDKNVRPDLEELGKSKFFSEVIPTAFWCG
jgi:hypothetical protein